MTADIEKIYQGYIACLNRRDVTVLKQSGYTTMLENNFIEIPDLQFTIQLLISNTDYLVSRLAFDCTPKENFLGIPINGKRVSFTEKVFYQFREKKIQEVWSIIDKAAIEAQL